MPAWDSVRDPHIEIIASDRAPSPVLRPDSDDIQQGERSPAPWLEGARVWLRYSDSNNQVTERFIRSISLERAEYGDYIHGFCELRNDWRSFLVSRITDIADAHGELHDVDDFLRPFLPTRGRRDHEPQRRSPFGRALILVDKVGDVARVLAFAGEADARFTKQEVAVATGVAADFAKRTGLHVTKTDLENFGRWVKLLRPTVKETEVACERIAARKVYTAADLAELIEIVVTIDGMVTTDERVAVEKLKMAVKSSFMT